MKYNNQTKDWQNGYAYGLKSGLYLMIIILLLFGVATTCNAQIDNMPYGIPYGIYDANSTKQKVSNDTIKVILVYIDTVFGKRGNISGIMPANITFWKFGYEVRELQYESKFDGGDSYWQHLEYLSESKKPLSKNIIVIQSFNAK